MGMPVSSDGDENRSKEGGAAASNSLDSLAAEATASADGYDTETCMAANPAAFVQYSGEDRNDSSAEGECKPQGNKQDGPPVPSPPAGAIRNPIS